MSSNLRITRICEYCEKEFTAKTTRTRYCSHTCNSRAYKAKQKSEKIQSIKNDLDKLNLPSIEEIQKREFLSISEACALIGVSRWTIWRAIKNGELKAGTIGRRKLIRRVDIESLFLEPSPKDQKKHVQKERESDETTLYDKYMYYTISEAQEKYGMSPKAFHDLLNRHGIKRNPKGRFVYVLKVDVDQIFNVSQKVTQ